MTFVCTAKGSFFIETTWMAPPFCPNINTASPLLAPLLIKCVVAVWGSPSPVTIEKNKIVNQADIDSNFFSNKCGSQITLEIALKAKKNVLCVRVI